MESAKKVSGASSSSSSSSFADLFGPKDTSVPSSSPGLFSSVFGPSSTGLGGDFSRSGVSTPSRNQNSASASEYDRSKLESQDNKTSKSYGKSGSAHTKDRSASYQKETAEPCNFNSSIYYGGDNDSNGSNSNSASRGNWWQGSLYY